eukprot:gene26161-28584_t
MHTLVDYVRGSSGTQPRRSFALCGQSVELDPRTHAVRRDLADIRLADRVFAPHYASCVQRVVISATGLREGADPESAVLTDLKTGDVFEVLEFVKGRAWGRAPGAGLVGYVDAATLSWPAA